MDSWENLVVQWINCLLYKLNDAIKTLDDLNDAKIYYKLINQIKSWSAKEYDSENDLVIHFLKEEYPYFAISKNRGKIENLCIASLILSRLSLEPVFHKSLCTNLHLDTQVKVKSILEALYPLGKKVTAEDLCRVFSCLDGSDTDTSGTKPKFLLREFLNSPVTRSVYSDNKIHEQTRQIRNLKADIETLRYEKSELIEDIKIQKKQINDLQGKLQDTLSEVKLLRADSLKSNSSNCSHEMHDTKILKSSYEKELQSLEKYVTELQDDNSQLQDEKTQLTSNLKICTEKYCILEEKNLKNEQIIESIMLQLEKKDEELSDLKIRHDELRNYFRERSRIYSNNASIEFDDKMISELSFNTSETLSSVVEIQLQDAHKEIAALQNKFKNTNTLFTILIEEHVKVIKNLEKILKENEKLKIKNDKCLIDKETQCLEIKFTDFTQQYDVVKIDKEMQYNYQIEIKDFSQQYDVAKSDKEMQYNYQTEIKDFSQQYDVAKSDKEMQYKYEIEIHDFSQQYDVMKSDKEVQYNYETEVNDFSQQYDIAKSDKQMQYNYEIQVKDFSHQYDIIKNDKETQFRYEIENNDFSQQFGVTKIDKNTQYQYQNKLQDFSQQCDTENEFINNQIKCNNQLTLDKTKLSYISNIFKSDFNNINKSLVLNLMNNFNSFKNSDTLKNNISFKINKETNEVVAIDNCLKNNESSKIFNNVDKNAIVCKFYKVLSQEHWKKQLVFYFNIFLQNNINDTISSCIAQKQKVDIYNIFDMMLKYTESQYSKSLQSHKHYSGTIILNKPKFEFLRLKWTLLYESISSSFKIHKVLLLLQKSWCYIVDSLKIVRSKNSYLHEDLKKILSKKDEVESDLQQINYRNLQILSMNFVTAVQFITFFQKYFNSIDILSNQKCLPSSKKSDNAKLTVLDFNLDNNQLLNLKQPNEITDKIKNTKRQMNDLKHLIQLYKKKKLDCENSTSLESKNKNSEGLIKKDNVELQNASSNVKSDKESNLNTVPTEVVIEKYKKQYEQNMKEIHEKYELKLEKMKDKMKSAFNNQLSIMKREQEAATMNKLQTLQSKLENQCFNHTEELKKYKKHISELTTQLWDVGEKLLIEKQKREEFCNKEKQCDFETQNTKPIKQELENHNVSFIKPELDINASIDSSSISKMQSVRGFQIMGNAFRNEDEEGEVFDTTYLTDMQTSRNPTNNLDRLSILQMRNAKCKPHLKSSYPAEMQFNPIPVTEDEIKQGSTSEEMFNDSLSQSLLTGKKVKRKDRSRNGSETPRRSRRFSNIFRKPRLSIDRKN